MEILFLGTAAATACPLPFCDCENCRAGRETGGKDFRRRSSVLIDGKLLIDMGPDLMSASFDFGIDTSKIEGLLQTHSHSDHFDAGHMITRIPDYATVEPKKLTVMASRECLEHMSEKLGREEGGATLTEEKWRKLLNVETVEMAHGRVITWRGYEITAVESAHDKWDGSLMYIIRKDDSAFFYACDTPELTESAWAVIENLGFPITVAAIDQCYGPGTPGGGHMHADQVAACVKRLGAGRAYATHISHEGTPPHARLEAWTRERGYGVAWDGMRLTF